MFPSCASLQGLFYIMVRQAPHLQQCAARRSATKHRLTYKVKLYVVVPPSASAPTAVCCTSQCHRAPPICSSVLYVTVPPSAVSSVRSGYTLQYRRAPPHLQACAVYRRARSATGHHLTCEVMRRARVRAERLRDCIVVLSAVPPHLQASCVVHRRRAAAPSADAPTALCYTPPCAQLLLTVPPSTTEPVRF